MTTTTAPANIPARATSILPLFRRALGDTWRSLVGWSLGVAAALFLYLPLYPAIGGNSDMQQLMSTLPPALVNALGYTLTTGAGYAQSTFFGLVGFVLIVIAATGWGTSALAGDEETGSLELILAHGVSRTQVVLERTAALVVRLVWLGALSGLIVLALNGSAELGVLADNLAGTILAWVGLGLVSGSLALAVGALTGRRLYATAAGAGAAVVGYALNAVANQSSDLDALHAWSPYAWAFQNSPLVDGTDWGGLSLLYGVSVLSVIVAVIALRRRDIAN